MKRTKLNPDRRTLMGMYKQAVAQLRGKDKAIAKMAVDHAVVEIDRDVLIDQLWHEKQLAQHGFVLRILNIGVFLLAASVIGSYLIWKAEGLTLNFVALVGTAILMVFGIVTLIMRNSAEPDYTIKTASGAKIPVSPGMREHTRRRMADMAGG